MEDRPARLSGPRVRHSRTDVVDAALAILDDQGLPDLTMRRLGEVLGVRPSALYWHFESKHALLAAVSSRILGPMEESGADARSLPSAASTLGAKLRDSLLAHRDGAELVSSSLALGLIDPPLHAQLSASARRTGGSETLARTAAEAITHLVIGYAFHEQQRRQADALGVTGESTGSGDFHAVLALVVAGLAASAEGP